MTDASDYIAAGHRRYRRWEAVSTAAKLIGALGVCCGLLAYELNGCQTPDSAALDALRQQGMTSVRLGGVHLGACADNETSRSFTAINGNDQHVTGTVCCGVVAKGCTIRW